MNETTPKKPRVMLQPPKDEIRRQLEVAKAEMAVAEAERDRWIIRALSAGFVLGLVVGWAVLPL